MEDYAKETKKIQQDLYKSIQKEADNWLANQVKNINELDKEFQKSFDKIQDKIDDTTKNLYEIEKIKVYDAKIKTTVFKRKAIKTVKMIDFHWKGKDR